MNENQIKKDVVVSPYFYGDNFYCPSCNKHLGADYNDLDDMNYCPKCGQPLNWENL